MNYSDKEVKTLYEKLVKQYHAEGWNKIASLDRFLHVKAEAALEKGNGKLYNLILGVILLADSDY